MNAEKNSRANNSGSRLILRVALLLFLFSAWPSPAQAAAPPLISDTGFSAVTETSVTLEARIDPNGAKIKDFHFDYIPLSVYEADGNSFGEGTLSTPVGTLPATVEGSGDLTISSKTIANLTTVAGTFAPGQSISGPGIPAATTITEATATTLTLSAAATATSSGAAITATGPQPVSADLTGLAAGSGYRFRLFAKNNPGELFSPELTFYTYSQAPLFGSCPNEILRSGELAPLGHPSAMLPDCRAYEQVSPVDKNGNDAIGVHGLSHAASDGQAATFIATSGIPGADGAQQIPAYLASRGGEGWSTTGLEPQAAAGPRARILGWTPDFSETVTQAVRQNVNTLEGALYVRSDPAAPATQASAYVPMRGNIQFAYAGASVDGGTIVFEAPLALPPKEGEAPIAASQPGVSNVYAYDAASGRVSLVSVMNSDLETKAALPKGAFAGPYDWARRHTGEGGSTNSAYTTDQRAVAADGSVFFTASGTGQLYERINPTEGQSPVNGAGECEDPALACTIHLSATEKNNGTGGGPDPAGPQPAAFQVASADGSQAFFTSSEKLTDDANTGPEQPPAQIGRATLADPDPNATKEMSFIPAHALGIAIDPKGEFIYWAEPLKGTIARANLKAPNPAATVDDEYIDTGETEAELSELEPPQTLKAHSTPLYVAVDEHHVYWTNPGPGSTQSFPCPYCAAPGSPIPTVGTIGRATIGATKGEDPRPEFITGLSNPRGIAVDATHVYWVNRVEAEHTGMTISRADLEGNGVDLKFAIRGDNEQLTALALRENTFYFASNGGSHEDESAVIERMALTGGEEDFVGFAGASKLRGIAVDANSVYWAAQGNGAIGRIPLADFPPAGSCSAVPSCNEDFLSLEGAPEGLAADSSHLYWSVNGEAPGNPGNDLYRYAAAPDPESHHLTDLTPNSTDPNGAEVFGVLGTTPDGSYTYFVANGDLDELGPAFAGDCKGSRLPVITGHCNLYLYHDGQVSFVAPLQLGGPFNTNDITDVVPSAAGLFGSEGVVEKTSFLAPSGALVFRSAEAEPPYETHGVPEFYRFAPGQGLACLTCDPTGGPSKAAGVEVNLGTPGMGPLNPAFTMAHALSEGGDRFFFQTASALVASDTDGQVSCPEHRFAPSCQDVYEWEAPGSGSCEAGAAGFSPLNHGCLYLLSPGDDTEPAFFSDASADGKSAFLYTRDQLVGQDTDGLIDLYAARVNGGLAAQNPLAKEGCEAEGCKPAVTPAPIAPSPQTPGFVGPENPKPPRCPKGEVLRKGKCQKQNQHGHKPKKRGHRSHAKSTGGQR